MMQMLVESSSVGQIYGRQFASMRACGVSRVGKRDKAGGMSKPSTSSESGEYVCMILLAAIRVAIPRKIGSMFKAKPGCMMKQRLLSCASGKEKKGHD